MWAIYDELNNMRSEEIPMFYEQEHMRTVMNFAILIN